MQTKYEPRQGTVYYVVAQYRHPQTNQAYTFKSDRLMSKPTNYAQGSSISVTFDQNDPTRYYMEIV